MTTELYVLAFSILLGIVHLVAASHFISFPLVRSMIWNVATGGIVLLLIALW
jgi:hypothetical protein